MRTDPSLRFSGGYKPQGLNLPGRHFQDGVSQSGKERNHLFLSTGNAFRDLAGISGADSIADGRSVALTDFDFDGYLDLALVNANAPMFELYRNRMSAVNTAESAGFIAMRFVGGNRGARADPKRSNRDGFGAVVEVELGGVMLLREHRAGEGMAAQNSATLLIGLGASDAAKKVVVRWPSGTVTEAESVAAGTLLTAYEVANDAGKLFERSEYRALRRVGDTATNPPAVPIPRFPEVSVLEASIERVLAYFGREVHLADPTWISLFGFLHRRFGIEVVLASGDLAHRVRGGVARRDMHEVYRRIDDPSAAIDKRIIADLPHVIDRITASALHCDRIELPANWLEILGNATRAGGYALTHALLATEWTVEQGCASRESVLSLREEQVRRLRAMIEERRALAGKFDSSTDLWIEALVMLYYGGSGDSVRAPWVHDLLAAQRDSGGWSKAPASREADPHASALALWVLLENSREPKPGPWIVEAGVTGTNR